MWKKNRRSDDVVLESLNTSLVVELQAVSSST